MECGAKVNYKTIGLGAGLESQHQMKKKGLEQQTKRKRQDFLASSRLAAPTLVPLVVQFSREQMAAQKCGLRVPGPVSKSVFCGMGLGKKQHRSEPCKIAEVQLKYFLISKSNFM